MAGRKNREKSLLKMDVDGKKYQIWYWTDAIQYMHTTTTHYMEYHGTVVEGDAFIEAAEKIRHVIRNTVIQ